MAEFVYVEPNVTYGETGGVYRPRILATGGWFYSEPNEYPAELLVRFYLNNSLRRTIVARSDDGTYEFKAMVGMALDWGTSYTWEARLCYWDDTLSQYVELGFNQSGTIATKSEDGSSFTVSTFISYNADGGSPTPNQQSVSDTSEEYGDYVDVVLSGITPQKQGYVFGGWKLNQSGPHWPGDTITVWADAAGTTYTLTAQWIVPTGNAWVFDGVSWKRLIVYQYTWNGWHEAVTNVYDGGWKS